MKAVSFVLGSNSNNRRIYRHLFCWSSIELALTVVSHIYLTDVSVHHVSESGFMVPVMKQIYKAVGIRSRTG